MVNIFRKTNHQKNKRQKDHLTYNLSAYANTSLDSRKSKKSFHPLQIHKQNPLTILMKKISSPPIDTKRKSPKKNYKIQSAWFAKMYKPTSIVDTHPPKTLNATYLKENQICHISKVLTNLLKFIKEQSKWKYKENLDSESKSTEAKET